MASRRVRIKGIANIPQRKRTVEKAAAPDGEPNLEARVEDGSETAVNAKKEEGKKEAIEEGEVRIASESKVLIWNEKVDEDGNEGNCNKKGVGEGEVSSEDSIRRGFVKPHVVVGVVNKKKEKEKDKLDGVVEMCKENLQEPVNVNLNETVIAANLSPIKSDQLPGPISVKITPSAFVPLKDFEKPSRCNSDTEYPPPPASPSKINRRIKAVPRLHQRRPSFSIGSASESEDDSRRGSYGRVRNDSVCSVASAATDTQPNSTREAPSPLRKDPPNPPPRKFRRSEQSRKIAEARRNFNLKFSDGKPDKQKLTMIDLIYYNPRSNPMNPRKRRNDTVKSDTLEELIDDPKEPINKKEEELNGEEGEENENGDEDDDDGGVPAPQIKVGPNGEIVIDEKSLVIENVETKRSRKALESAEVVDGDFDTSYGIYKRAKRAKDWNDEETLRFYKALNTIGTDFTMMCELFPKRTRRELKLKFKHEEKTNRVLVDRAIMQPVEFDMTQLQNDLEEHERSLEERKNRAKEVKETFERKRRENRKGKCSFGRVDEIENKETGIENRRTKRKLRKKSTYENLRKGIDSVLDETESSEPSEEEYLPRGKSKLKTESYSKLEDPKEKTDLELGSIMIVPTSESTKTTYNVFMVTESDEKEKEKSQKVVNVHNIITISENAPNPNISNDDIQITDDGIIFRFDECPGLPPLVDGKPNVTISHDDNKMTIVSES